MINGKPTPAKALIQQRSVTVCRKLTGLEGNIVPGIIFSIWTRPIVSLIKLNLASAHFQFSGKRNKEKSAKDLNQDNPVAITVMATSSPAASEKVAPQINSTSSSAISSMSDMAS